MVNIQFVFGQLINLSFDKFYGKNMISDLLHNTPVNETRSIVYLSTGYTGTLTDLVLPFSDRVPVRVPTWVLDLTVVPKEPALTAVP